MDSWEPGGRAIPKGEDRGGAVQGRGLVREAVRQGSEQGVPRGQGRAGGVLETHNAALLGVEQFRAGDRERGHPAPGDWGCGNKGQEERMRLMWMKWFLFDYQILLYLIEQRNEQLEQSAGGLAEANKQP